jgi:hypothetical protein
MTAPPPLPVLSPHVLASPVGATQADEDVDPEGLVLPEEHIEHEVPSNVLEA